MNEISDEGAKAIANELKSTEYVRTIELAKNKIGHAGAVALLNIQSPKPFWSVNLNENKLGDEFAKYLIK
jgi:hypothetical protein